MRGSYSDVPEHSGKEQGWHLGGWGVFGLVILALVILGILAFVVLLTSGLFGGHMRGGVCPWCGGRGMMGGWGILGTLTALGLGLGLVILLVVGVVVIMRRSGEGKPFLSNDAATARETLDQRYARGEISEAEYQRMIEQLES